MTAQLSVHDLSLIRNGQKLFTHLSFTAREGDIIYITGKNGTGKTTLLRYIAGLFHPLTSYKNYDTSETMSLQYNGYEITQKTQEQWRQHFGFLGCKDPLYHHLTAYENIIARQQCLGLSVLSSKDQDKKLTHAGLFNMRHTAIRYFSSGQKRRLSLLLTSLYECPIYLLDEPDIMLDEAGLNYLSDFLHTQRQNNAIILMTTHHHNRIKKSSSIHLDDYLSPYNIYEDD